MHLYHETLTFERRFRCAPSCLFEAYANPREREAWTSMGSGEVVRIERSDLRTGGSELARCGSEDELPWTMETAYHVVEPDRTIVFTEVLKEGTRVLTVALVTFAISEEGDGCRLDLTDQVTSFVGKDGVAGHREGYTRAIGNLAGMVDRQAPVA